MDGGVVLVPGLLAGEVVAALAGQPGQVKAELGQRQGRLVNRVSCGGTWNSSCVHSSTFVATAICCDASKSFAAPNRAVASFGPAPRNVTNRPDASRPAISAAASLHQSSVLAAWLASCSHASRIAWSLPARGVRRASSMSVHSIPT